jgi:hypothetical protein
MAENPIVERCSKPDISAMPDRQTKPEILDFRLISGLATRLKPSSC